MHPDHTHLLSFPCLPSSPPPVLLYTPPQKKRKLEKKQVHFVLSIYSLEHGQIPRGQPPPWSPGRTKVSLPASLPEAKDWSISLFMCLSVCLCVFMCTVCAQYPGWPEGGIRSPGMDLLAVLSHHWMMETDPQSSARAGNHDC